MYRHILEKTTKNQQQQELRVQYNVSLWREMKKRVQPVPGMSIFVVNANVA